jgi:hypothetical protein
MDERKRLSEKMVAANQQKLSKDDGDLKNYLHRPIGR